MPKIRLDINQITPGMKLAEPITNASGVTLMPSGIRLTPMFIVRLKKWNIESLEVIVDDFNKTADSGNGKQPRQSHATAAGLTAEQEEFTRRIATEVYGWFANVRENPLMMQLRSVAVKRLVAHGPEGMLNIMRLRDKADGDGNTVAEDSR